MHLSCPDRQKALFHKHQRDDFLLHKIKRICSIVDSDKKAVSE